MIALAGHPGLRLLELGAREHSRLAGIIQAKTFVAWAIQWMSVTIADRSQAS